MINIVDSGMMMITIMVNVVIKPKGGNRDSDGNEADNADSEEDDDETVLMLMTVMFMI